MELPMCALILVLPFAIIMGFIIINHWESILKFTLSPFKMVINAVQNMKLISYLEFPKLVWRTSVLAASIWLIVFVFNNVKIVPCGGEKQTASIEHKPCNCP